MSTTFEKNATSTTTIPRPTAVPQNPEATNADAYAYNDANANAYAYNNANANANADAYNDANADAKTKLHTKRQVRGAAVAGGVTGLVLLGPAAGLLAAGGAALATTKGKGKVGEAARATGDSISDLGKSVKKFDEKHHIKEKTSATIVKGCHWISKKLDKHKNNKNKSGRDVMS
eukprot:CAMPEP_0172391630 /NCGR_PEP_ID=MMETSP1061-20121228/7984_1 /TAXON_ID=37318 /ORGANISM="Pseudo-nitzschia pungens, Strain cf. pungens" /LENGTH=174 /DNA_ID=CAMNT_0013122301 /DNA_START=190 /DNA_END=714 /DNA_ORIENTATION=+